MIYLNPNIVLKVNDLIKDKKIIVFFFIIASLCCLAYSGLNIFTLCIYNFGFIEIMENKSIYEPSITLYQMTAIKNIGNFCLEKMGFLYTMPIIYLSLSFLIKVIFFWLIFKIAELFLKDTFFSFLFSLYFVLSESYHFHGVSPIGIWGAPLFINSCICAVLCLFSIYMFMKKRFLWACILASLSMQFHSLYGFSFILNILLGGSFYTFKNCYSKKDKIKIFISAVLILYGILFYYLDFKGINSNVEGIENASIPEWITFLWTNPDDVFLFHTYTTYGYVLIPVVFFACYLCYNYRKDTESDSVRFLFLGSLFFNVAIFLFELLNLSGIYFGWISNMFFAVQLRRGVWVLGILSTLLIFKYIKENWEKHINIILPIFIMSLYMNVFYSIVLFPFLLFFKRNKMVLIGFIIYIFAIVVFFMSDAVSTVAMNKISKYVVYFLLSYGFCICSWFLIKKNKILLLLPVISYLFIFSTYGIYTGLLEGEFKTFFKNGPFKKCTIEDLISHIYQNGNKQEIMVELRNKNINHSTVLFPPHEIENLDPYLSKNTFLIDQSEYGVAQFSHKYYEILLYKLKYILDIENPKTLFEGKGLFQEQYFENMRNKYNNLSASHLKEISKKYKIEYFVSETEYSDLEVVSKKGKYYLYYMQKL